jgi:hypothetical protein
VSVGTYPSCDDGIRNNLFLTDGKSQYASIHRREVATSIQNIEIVAVYEVGTPVFLQIKHRPDVRIQ